MMTVVVFLLWIIVAITAAYVSLITIVMAFGQNWTLLAIYTLSLCAHWLLFGAESLLWPWSSTQCFSLSLLCVINTRWPIYKPYKTTTPSGTLFLFLTAFILQPFDSLLSLFSISDKVSLDVRYLRRIAGISVVHLDGFEPAKS